MDDKKRLAYNARKQKWRDEHRERTREIGRNFANSEKGQKHRKKWRDAHPENIRAATARYKAAMTPEERRLTAQKHRNNPQTKLKRRLKEAEKRAAKSGLPFDQALYEYTLANPPTHCACCSVKLDYAVKGRGCRNNGPSVDRVINSDGYTLTNTQWICGFCNARKSDSSLDQLLMIVAYIQRHLQSLGK
jgi:hypothetical protein